MPPKGSKRKGSMGAAKTAKKASVSASTRAGLMFPVGRFRTMLRKGRFSSGNIGSDAGIVAAAVCEFITKELFVVALEQMERSNKKTIAPTHIQKAILSDSDFTKLLANVQISGGGMLPNILKELMPKKKGKKAAEE
jgi:histone H2A